MQAYVPLRLDGDMRKCGKTSICTSTSTGRNAQDRKFWAKRPWGETSTCMGWIVQRAKRPRVWGESCRWRHVQEAKRPGGETSRQEAKRRGGEKSSYPAPSFQPFTHARCLDKAQYGLFDGSSVADHPILFTRVFFQFVNGIWLAYI